MPRQRGQPLSSAKLATQWLHSTASYGIQPSTSFVEHQIPYSAFTAEQVTTMLNGDKLCPFSEKDHGKILYCTKAFW